MKNFSDNIEEFARNILNITLRDDQGDFLYHDLQRSEKRIVTVCSMTRGWGLTTCLLTYALWNAWRYESAVDYIVPSYTQINYMYKNPLIRSNGDVIRKDSTFRFINGGIVRFLNGHESLTLTPWSGQKHLALYDNVKIDSDVYGKYERNDNNSIVYAMSIDNAEYDNVFLTWEEERPVNPNIHAVIVGDEW